MMDIQNIEKDLEATMDKYGSLLLKMCILMLKNKCDAEDVVQNTLVKYYTANVSFVFQSSRSSGGFVWNRHDTESPSWIRWIAFASSGAMHSVCTWQPSRSS